MLDNYDRKILEALQSNGRMAFTELGKQVGLTTTPCIERVKKLERRGYITGYTATLNPTQLELGLIVFVQVSLSKSSPQSFGHFRKCIKQLPEVQECHLVTGNFDFLIKARVSDMSAYRDFLENHLLSIQGVEDSTSIAVMETVQENQNLSIKA
ncbi:MAG: Lrp/AsnC ligand binding domain-containing protein [Pseudomonadota bacterium]